MKWLQECLWALKEDLPVLVSFCRLALAMWLASSCHSSLMHSSCCLQGSTLGSTAHSPCKLVLPPSGSLHQGTLKGSAQRSVQGLTWLPQILILGSTFDALFSAWQPCYGSMCSNRNRLHSCFWVVLQPRCSLCKLFKNSWLWGVWLATQFEQLVLWVNSLTHCPSMEKFP